MDFARLSDYMDTLAAVGVPGCDMIVYKDHEPIFRHMAGCRDAEGQQPVRGDEVYRLYSCTKVFTTCAIMQLVEQGRLHLDDPVQQYLPAFAGMSVIEDGQVRPARRVMTIRHLLSMQSGLDYDMETPNLKRAVQTYGDEATTRQIVDAKAQDPLRFEPGTDFLYSLSHDVLGAVIEVVSGQRFSAYLKEHLFDPLELKTIGFALRESDRPRLSQLFRYDAEQKKPVPCGDALNLRFSKAYESGGGGLLGDVRDYSRFVDALACGGTTERGDRLLLPQTMQLWSANQLCPKGRETFDGWHRLGYSYALGVRTRVDVSQGGAGQIGEFGWDGAAGAWAMIDPINHLSAFFAMHVLDFSYAFDVIHPTLRSLLYECVG